MMVQNLFEKRAIFLSAILFLSIAAPISAQQTASNDRRSYTQVIFNLEDEGYQVTELTTTLLGRVRIIARNSVHLREVVVSRATGEIKSDVILKIFALNSGDAKATTTKSISSTATGGTSFSGGGVAASVGSNGVSASIGGNGGVSASVGGGGISAGVGGVSAGLGGLLGN